jgi:hypothetical protein
MPCACGISIIIAISNLIVCAFAIHVLYYMREVFVICGNTVCVSCYVKAT